MWMCHVHYVPGQEGCEFFQWADFDEDGEPVWGRGRRRGGAGGSGGADDDGRGGEQMDEVVDS